MVHLKISKPFWQVFGLGLLAGMRTTSALVIVSQILSKHPSKQLAKSPLSFMQSGVTAIGVKILAAGELVGDKLPKTPDRTSTTGLIGRCLSGSLAGATIYKASGNNALTGALLGSIVAFGSTFGSFYLRKFIVDKKDVFDPYIGVFEDALVAGGGVALIISA